MCRRWCTRISFSVFSQTDRPKTNVLDDLEEEDEDDEQLHTFVGTITQLETYSGQKVSLGFLEDMSVSGNTWLIYKINKNFTNPPSKKITTCTFLFNWN